MKTLAPLINPRLKSNSSTGKKVGYLQLSADAELMTIGPTTSREYKLIQSLFNPTNTSTRYNAVQQTHERTYANVIGVPSPGAYDRTKAVLNRVMANVRKTEAGKYISFTQTPNYLAMEIHADRSFA